MNAVTGKGSRVIAEPDEQQVEYHPGPLPAPRATALLAGAAASPDLTARARR